MPHLKGTIVSHAEDLEDYVAKMFLESIHLNGKPKDYRFLTGGLEEVESIDDSKDMQHTDVWRFAVCSCLNYFVLSLHEIDGVFREMASCLLFLIKKKIYIYFLACIGHFGIFGTREELPL